MPHKHELEKTPQLSILWILLYRIESQAWALSHWLVTHWFGLRFCPSCSGYFRAASMALPETCRACYAWKYGLDR